MAGGGERCACPHAAFDFLDHVAAIFDFLHGKAAAQWPVRIQDHATGAVGVIETAGNLLVFSIAHESFVELDRLREGDRGE
jgi:hypothetical protein